MAYRPRTAGSRAARERSRSNGRAKRAPPAAVVPAAATDSVPPPTHVGHYLIGKTLGQGTFGKVRSWLGRQAAAGAATSPLHSLGRVRAPPPASCSRAATLCLKMAPSNDYVRR